MTPPRQLEGRRKRALTSPPRRGGIAGVSAQLLGGAGGVMARGRLAFKRRLADRERFAREVERIPEGAPAQLEGGCRALTILDGGSEGRGRVKSSDSMVERNAIRQSKVEYQPQLVAGAQRSRRTGSVGRFRMRDEVADRAGWWLRFVAT